VIPPGPTEDEVMSALKEHLSMAHEALSLIEARLREIVREELQVAEAQLRDRMERTAALLQRWDGAGRPPEAEPAPTLRYEIKSLRAEVEELRRVSQSEAQLRALSPLAPLDEGQGPQPQRAPPAGPQSPLGDEHE